jgi:radical SAM protein with 4Fe4S-binding SPASM domain
MEDCGSIPQQGYGDFSEWLHQKVGNRHIPVFGSLEVTMRCNLRCRHCYIPGQERAAHEQNDLSLVEIKHLLDEVTDAGCLWMLLTGGEPLLRPDFRDIYSYARQKGLILTLFTNGTLITPEIADFLAQWRPFNIEISLYGASQETYERVTGIPGSYARCRQGIDLLLERKLPLGLKSVVMTLNQAELAEMQTLAESLGVTYRFDPVINPGLDGSARPTRLRLLPQEIVAIEQADPNRSLAWPESFRGKLGYKIPDRKLYLCGAGKNSFHIDASGKMSMCISSRNPAYDLRAGSFKEGWEDFLPRVTARQYSEQFLCAGCELRMACAQCPAVAELETQDAEQRVEFLCHLTKLRYQAFGQKSGV